MVTLSLEKRNKKRRQPVKRFPLKQNVLLVPLPRSKVEDSTTYRGQIGVGEPFKRLLVRSVKRYHESQYRTSHLSAL